jgi:hypothetical protein
MLAAASRNLTTTAANSISADERIDARCAAPRDGSDSR